MGVLKAKLGPLVSRLALVLAGLLAGIVLIEVVLAFAGIPRFYRPHSVATQFMPVRMMDHRFVHYTNMPSETIRFVYDGNPRGYFGPENAVDHRTNSDGFRGAEFELQKPPGTVRLFFLGDSFMFGEGVRGKDTLCEVTARLLGEETTLSSFEFESFNLGVGGFNTTQELRVFKDFIKYRPDLVVVGYVLNDAEEPLIERDRRTGAFVHRSRDRSVKLSADDSRPPDSLLYKLRGSRMLWQLFRNRALSSRMIASYRSQFEPECRGWQESRRALARIIDLSKKEGAACVVVCFPMLFRLDDSYPFREIHRKVGEWVESEGGIFLDLLEELEGRKPSELWVHPSDKHPNEIVHRVAAEALTGLIVDRRLLDGKR